MVTYYNKKDLISFGKYLLSEERTTNIEVATYNNCAPIEDRLKEVYHADLENWMVKEHPITEVEAVSMLDEMCAHSLNPEQFEQWEAIKHTLKTVRKNQKSAHDNPLLLPKPQSPCN